jgi:hypothetical protein
VLSDRLLHPAAHSAVEQNTVNIFLHSCTLLAQLESHYFIDILQLFSL